ncbi:MAG: NGG1p interacting factor NIF3 [Candidatus Portnoybacteria bacterium CG_4_8_14_3_um_filter_44_10]|uniref:NGG1p interacting factor NIF3 n=5 Tax=Candidatus Portnoyibacteriota TaxID=1817913 RepID=A0A2H0KRU0_9BACT|nr:MAG: NGG1p interacting factor NIF3 [Parcubacteria group bacterium CG2_30_44_18]PIQ74124.1 MAG: NGG1p interacting factor NIF3 [Candidatus Portnoybacteria bacterium CG11_big_fil_rev_8_21_14_0_20_44_10]PIS16716.1 MAG: NGG1p interacting factor NIF3 [Candidatus Portnoybacteria bacterium CG09_land_8_20_14_0_10_44_13]PIW75736.1 MAG: NGG1p interacting factor NIF3 [Candidatus Portnoybacteria bacterium CG_4_8_14_3_um_filter_44_10]PIZ68765.1 MAG: NGG1p interacting factor NIF3 [Candidatus Portnoybacteri
MTIGEIYDLAIKMGIESDLRGKDFVLKQLKKEKESYQKLSPEKKKEYDKEKMSNPYSDSRILCGDPNKKVKRMMVGVEIEPAELMIAKYLSDSGQKIDLVMSHHPLGHALADLSDVMHLQAEVWHQHGVPINIAESVMRPRISEIFRMVPSSANFDRSVHAAKLLELPLICLHTPLDNLVAKFLDQKIKKDQPETVGEVLESLKEVSEYKEASKYKAGPRIFVGHKEARAGKIALTEITGGTNGAKEMYEYVSKAGIGTIVGMHMREEWRKEAEAHHVNVIICGDTQSDSIGINLFLDELEKRGIEIVPCSGLIRVSRGKRKK